MCGGLCTDRYAGGVRWCRRGSRIEPGARITGPAWIGHGCVVRAGAHITRSVLFEYTRIAANMHFHEMVVSRHYCVNRFGETSYQGDEATPLRWGDARADSHAPTHTASTRGA